MGTVERLVKDGSFVNSAISGLSVEVLAKMYHATIEQVKLALKWLGL